MPDARWFLSHRMKSPPAQVFCFPAAGGDPHAFLEWQHGMGTDAQLVAVCMPGRWHRTDEQAPAGIAELADEAAAAISAHAEGPFVLFGHSMGAVVAFEVARRLRDAYGLRHLVASGCAAPARNPSDYITWSDGNHGRVFAEAAAAFLGLSPEFLAASDEVQALLLADLRADVHLLAEYRHEPAAPLPIEVSVICGRNDPHVDPDGVEAWRAECLTAPSVHWADGDHFFLNERPSAVIEVLRPIVRRASGRADDPVDHVEMI